MATQSLEEWVQAQDDVVGTLRAQGGAYEENFPVVPNEQTNWLDEARAIVEDCAVADLSHHMTAVHLRGPDVISLLSNLCINDFEEFPVGRAKQIVMCSPDGYVMGDGPLLRLGEREFYGPGIHATKWLAFNVATGDYDVDASFEPPTPLLDGDPAEFVLQVQGPKAYDVLGELTDADLRAIGFYAFETIDLAGREVRAFGHGMSPESGFEFHGPYAYHDELQEALVEAGEPYGLKLLGSRTYVSNSVRLSWIPPFMKPVYDAPEMEAYREWATPAREGRFGKFWAGEATLESSFSIEGSFDAEDIREYYLTPVELGYGKLVDLDHDFVGREAVAAELESPSREKVSLIWDREDAEAINGSIFGDGPVHKYMDSLPRVGFARQAYDRVERDGDLVGISHGRSFEWDVRTIVSLACVDVEHSDPGTEVTLVWGEPGGTSPNPNIPEHTPVDVSATVQPAPYTTDHRRAHE